MIARVLITYRFFKGGLHLAEILPIRRIQSINRVDNVFDETFNIHCPPLLWSRILFDSMCQIRSRWTRAKTDTPFGGVGGGQLQPTEPQPSGIPQTENDAKSVNERKYINCIRVMLYISKLVKKSSKTTFNT